MMNKIVTIDVNLPSHVDADVSESELYEEYDNENKLHEVERGITKMSKENECVDEEEALYESYDYSSGENKGTTKYTTTILKKPFNRKGKSIPPDDADMIEEFVYEESQTGETDPKNTNQGDVLLKTANSLQYYDEALYEEPVSSNFRDSGLPNFPAPDIPNVPMLSMTLLNKSGKALKTDAGKLHMINEDFSNENVTKSINGNGESNQKAERSVSYITASTPSPEPHNVPKRKRQVAPNSSVSPKNISGNVSRALGEDNLI
ncbi:hypothetical protein CHS0354_004094 [Potamilus streckersoni]|uniref:Uncharacterized protein n=1 Tax=Potamilus streckersoni TaxID=2493646 RepID=A0AAE0SJJ9_9BIVA|nr:hypothetical protein CHS0354_004094 [Potamilus streckersoni]